MSKKYAIIVAGGRGIRLGGEVPKQFLELAGKPVLMHAIDAFLRYDEGIHLILVLPETQISFWNELCRKHNFKQKCPIAKGGETRFHSVKNGLSLIDGEGLVAIHDGVRPLVSADTISRCFEAAAEHRAAVPVVDSVDSIRQIIDSESIAVARENFKLVQTPQVFDVRLLKDAYQQAFTSAFTDDASVVEAFGAKIHLTEGNRENIKITTVFDLKIAQCLIRHADDADNADFRR
ncbi:2-C-methyl-D-erythritol 4-phosphate cytidylyltransferase [Bacteroidia bacterium]|nr:2-C-methyl-D-erythritol 4-phosphate cytidylyltransferase [Bacteroidia bacterium]